MTSHRRGPWSQAEDAYLTQLVHTQGPLNWVRISQLIGSRSPKQCRERYHQNLKPTLNHEPISPEEGLLIERLVSEIGKRWAEIARRLHGRSDNAVKNWWNGSMNRRRRLVVRRRTSSRTQDDYDEGPEMSPYSHHSGHHQSLTIGSPYSGRRHIDQSLPSPVVSEASRAESVSNPPSLVSDSGSRHSTSPRGQPSPVISLPPLAGNSDDRRQSIPMLHFPSSSYTSESDAQGHSFSSRYAQETKFARPNQAPYVQPVSRWYDNAAPQPEYRPSYSDAQPRMLPDHPSASVQLPPIQSLSRLSVRTPESPANRMNIASVLG